MATGTSPPPLPPGYQNDTARYGDFVDEHLAKVRNGIRVSDFFAKAMGLGAVILIYLLGLIIIDHWVTDLGTFGRVLGLAGLILGSGYYIVRYLLPDLMRKINPAYAAQMVEQTEPSLRNSLINFVLLRPKRESVREVIYHQVEQQAATRLSRVDVADAVDQTPLIRLALCLLGALILFAAYTIFSPKSPFQSIGRILSPFSEVSRPARVRISDIQPRNTTVFAGDAVEVSAIVDVDDDSEPVWLIYSTTDGQKVDVKRPMLRDTISMRHVATPTDDGTISQTIDYRIVSGDAEEGPFRITVSQAPTIFVEEIVLDYPKYTELAAETLDNQADIRALEGTRVTVRGRTNQDIDSAIIELDPGAKKPVRLKMTSDGRTAEGSFLIKLREDRQTPLNESYRLVFTSVDGKVSQNAVEHTIEVLPDLPPQVEILTPAQLEIELPQNAQQTIEVRGLDPDYGLADMRVQAAVGRKLVVDHSLLSDPGLGQRVGKFVFRPRQYGLQPGDEVVFIGLAKDNRADAQTGSPTPNVSATQRYKIRITEPRLVPPNEDEGLQQDDGRNDQPAPGDEGGADGDEGEGEGEKGEGGGAEGEGGEDGEGDDGETGEGGAGAESEGQEGEGGENEGAEGEGQEGAGGKSQGEDGEGAEGEGQEGAGTEKGEGDRKGNAANGDQAEGGADGEGDADGSKREGEGGELGGEGDPQAGHEEGGERGTGDPQREGTPGGEATEGGNDPTTNARGADPDGDDPAGKRPGEEGGDPGDVDEAGEPLDSNGGDDGEAFDRIVEHMKDKFGEATDGTPQPCPNGECANEGSEGGGSNNPGEGGDPNESEGEKGASDGDEPGDKPGAEGDEPGEGEGKTGENPGGENGDKEGEAAGEGDNGDKGAGEEAGDNPGAEGDKPGKGDEGKGEGEGDNGEGAEGGNGNKPGDEKGNNGGPNGDQPGEQDGEGAEGEEGEGQGDGEGDKGKGDKPGENGQPSSNGGGKPGGENAEGEGAGQNPDGQEADANQQPGDKQGSDASDSTAGGADSQQGAQSPNAPGGEGEWFDDEELPEPGGDDPNLEYARKATNLALDYLKHNKDEKLQEDLGWTDKQMQDFVKRWQQMQNGAAPSDSADPDRELNDALRSLGMRRGSDRIRASNSKDDKARVRDSGTRSQPPAEYIDQYRAYLKSLGKRPRK